MLLADFFVIVVKKLLDCAKVCIIIAKMIDDCLKIYYSMSKIVQPLIDDGKIALTLPDKPKSSKQRYVRK